MPGIERCGCHGLRLVSYLTSYGYPVDSSQLLLILNQHALTEFAFVLPIRRKSSRHHRSGGNADWSRGFGRLRLSRKFGFMRRWEEALLLYRTLLRFSRVGLRVYGLRNFSWWCLCRQNRATEGTHRGGVTFLSRCLSSRWPLPRRLSQRWALLLWLRYWVELAWQTNRLLANHLLHIIDFDWRRSEFCSGLSLRLRFNYLHHLVLTARSATGEWAAKLHVAWLSRDLFRHLVWPKGGLFRWRNWLRQWLYKCIWDTIVAFDLVAPRGLSHEMCQCFRQFGIEMLDYVGFLCIWEALYEVVFKAFWFHHHYVFVRWWYAKRFEIQEQLVQTRFKKIIYIFILHF